MDRKLDELLHALMENMTITVSGEKLARDLGVSHSTLARWIDKLRDFGIEIRGELFTGYRLTRLPDELLPQLIRPRLEHRFAFFQVLGPVVDALSAPMCIAHVRELPLNCFTSPTLLA